jgi:SAM-dependent methyltransferase
MPSVRSSTTFSAFDIIRSCRGCSSPRADWPVVFRMEPMPLAGQFCATREEAQTAARYPLTWVQCPRCALVQVLEDIDDALLFTSYNYASSTVPGLVRHFEQFAAALAARYGRSGIRLLEIGCNDGVLLRRLPIEWQLTGVDPSDVARQSEARGDTLVNEPFSWRLAQALPERARYDVVTGSNCLAHVTDLGDIFRGVHALLRPGGEFIIEVHDLDATLAGAQWDTVYHEHKAEWSESSLRRCLAYAGFDAVSVERLPLHGGLLRAIFRKAAPQVIGSPEGADVFAGLRHAYERRRETPTYRAAAALVAQGGSVCAYGASGRANVWLNQLPELRVEYVVDESPLRAGRWLPAVCTPVVPPSTFRERPADACVITAWNYAADIRRKHPEFAGQWLQTFAA